MPLEFGEPVGRSRSREPGAAAKRPQGWAGGSSESASGRMNGAASPQGGEWDAWKGTGARQQHGYGEPLETIGEGEHEQTVMMAVTQALADHERRIGQAEAVLFQSWALKPGPVPETALARMKDYAAACRQAKGTKTKVGHGKNYCFFGLLEGLLKAGAVAGTVEKEVEEILERLCSTGPKQVEVWQAHKLEEVVAYAQVTKGKNVIYLNIRLHDSHRDLERRLEETWAKLGDRQWDPPPPKPVMRDLRKWRDDKRANDAR